MAKTITVKGTGKVSAAPDRVEIRMELEARSKEYETAMEMAAVKIDQLTQVLVQAGFEKEDLKTTSFRVSTNYDSIKRQDGHYDRVLTAYVVSHDLHLRFDFDTKRLAIALSSLGSCLAHPELSIRFTVSDPEALREQLLRDACENARKKAEILAVSSGRKLGELQTIDYSWGELYVESHTNFCMDGCFADVEPMSKAIDFTPEDIDMEDTVTFVWELA